MTSPLPQPAGTEMSDNRHPPWTSPSPPPPTQVAGQQISPDVSQSLAYETVIQQLQIKISRDDETIIALRAKNKSLTSKCKKYKRQSKLANKNDNRDKPQRYLDQGYDSTKVFAPLQCSPPINPVTPSVNKKPALVRVSGAEKIVSPVKTPLKSLQAAAKRAFILRSFLASPKSRVTSPSGGRLSDSSDEDDNANVDGNGDDEEGAFSNDDSIHGDDDGELLLNSHRANVIFSKSHVGVLSDDEGDYGDAKSDVEGLDHDSTLNDGLSTDAVNTPEAKIYTSPHYLSPLLESSPSSATPKLRPTIAVTFHDDAPSRTEFVHPMYAVVDELDATFHLAQAVIKIQSQFRVAVARARVDRVRVDKTHSNDRILEAAIKIQSILRMQMAMSEICRVRLNQNKVVEDLYVQEGTAAVRKKLRDAASSFASEEQNDLPVQAQIIGIDKIEELSTLLAKERTASVRLQQEKDALEAKYDNLNAARSREISRLNSKLQENQEISLQKLQESREVSLFQREENRTKLYEAQVARRDAQREHDQVSNSSVELSTLLAKERTASVRLQKSKEEIIEERATLEGRIKQLEDDKVKLVEEKKSIVIECDVKVQEAECLRDEAIKSCEAVQQRANNRASALAEKRVQSLQQSHSLEMSSLDSSWEERLKNSKAEDTLNIARIEKEYSLKAVKKNREIESRHYQELKRIEDDWRSRRDEAKLQGERDIRAVEARHRDEMREVEKSAAERVRNCVLDEKSKWQAITNEIRDDCKVQILNIQKVLEGEQRNSKEARILLKKQSNEKIRDVSEATTQARIALEEKYNKRMFLKNQKWTMEKNKMAQLHEDRISALQSLLQMKAARIAECEKMLGFESWLERDHAETTAFIEHRLPPANVAAPKSPSMPLIPTSTSASTSTAIPHPFTPLSHSIYSKRSARATPVKGESSTSDSLSKDCVTRVGHHHRHPPPNHPPPEKKSATNEWQSPTAEHRAVEETVAKISASQEGQSRKHVSNTSSGILQQNVHSVGKPPSSQSPTVSADNSHHLRSFEPSQMRGANMAFRSLSRHAKLARNAFFVKWRDKISHRKRQVGYLQRILVRARKVALGMYFQDWLDSARSIKRAEYDEKIFKMQHEISLEADGKYDDFLLRLQSMRFENERLLALHSNKVIDELRREVSKVEEELKVAKSEVGELPVKLTEFLSNPAKSISRGDVAAGSDSIIFRGSARFSYM